MGGETPFRPQSLGEGRRVRVPSVLAKTSRECGRGRGARARARGAGAVDPGALAAAAVAGPPTDGRVLTPASAVFA